MGEAYRGLTIMIGADATRLRRELSVVNKAANATKAELRAIGNALKDDPASVRAVEMRMDSLSHSAEDVALKCRKITEALKAAGHEDLSGMMRGFGNASLRAEQLRDAYNDVNAILERMRRRYAALGAEIRGVDLTTATPELREELFRVGLEAKNATEQYRALSARHNELQESLRRADSARGMRKLATEAEEAHARIRGIAREARQMRSQGLGSEMASDARRLRDLLDGDREAANRLREELRKLDSALEGAPGDLRLTELRARNINEQVEETEEHQRRLNEEIRKMRAAGIDHAGKSFNTLEREVKEAGDEFERLKFDVAQAEARLSALDGELDKLRNADAAGEDVARDLRRVEAEAEDARRDVDRLRKELENASRAFDGRLAARELRRAEVEVDSLDGKLRQLNLEGRLGSMVSRGRTSNALRTYGYGVTATMGMAFGMAASEISDSTETIDAAYRDMRKTVDGTEEQFQQLLDSAIRFSQTHITSADTILEIEAMGGQLGITADKLEEFALVASNLDIATDIESQDIAQAMGQLNNIMRWGEGDMERFGDALVHLGNNMPAQESAILNVTKRIGAAGAMYGFTTPQVLAWATAIASTGQNSEAAGTAISRTIAMIEEAVAEGGSELDTFASTAGMSSDSFAALWNADASAAFDAFIQGLHDIDRAGGSVDVRLGELHINAVRQRQALRGLANTIDVARAAMDYAEEGWYEGGQAMEEAEKKSEGFSGAIGKLRNSIQDVAYVVGNDFTGPVNAVAGAVADMSDVIDATPGPVKQMGVAIGALVAGTGPLAIATGALMQGREIWEQFKLSRPITTLSNLRVKLSQNAGAVGKVASALGKLRASWVLVAVAAAAVVATNVASYFSEMEERARTLTGLVGGYASSLDSARSSASSLVADGSMAALADEASKLREESDTFASSLLETYDSLAEKQVTGETDIALVRRYADTIKELGGRNDLTAREQARLNAAVKGFNELTGSTISLRSFVGQYQELCDAIDRAAGSFEETTRKGVLQEILGESERAEERARQQLAIAEETVELLEGKYAEAQRALEEGATVGNFGGDTDTLRAVADTKKALDDANAAVETYRAALEGAETTTRAATDALSDYETEQKDARRSTLSAEKAIDQIASSMREGSKAASSLGDATIDADDAIQRIDDALQDLRDDEVDVTTATTSVNEALEEAGITATSLSEDMVQMASDSQVAGQDLYELAAATDREASAAAAASKIASEEAEAFARAREEAIQKKDAIVSAALADRHLTAAIRRTYGNTTDLVRGVADAVGGFGALHDALSSPIADIQVFATSMMQAGHEAEALSNAMSALSSVSDPLSAYEYDWEGHNLDKLRQGLAVNTQVVSDWAGGMSRIWDMAGDENELAFAQYLQDMGVDSATIIQQIFDSGDADSTFSQLAADYAAYGQALADAAVQGIKNADDASARVLGEDTAETIATTVVDTLGDAFEYQGQTVDFIQSLFGGSFEQAADLAEAGGSTLASRMRSGFEERFSDSIDQRLGIVVTTEGTKVDTHGFQQAMSGLNEELRRQRPTDVNVSPRVIVGGINQEELNERLSSVFGELGQTKYNIDVRPTSTVEVQKPSSVVTDAVVGAIRGAETEVSGSETVSVKPGSTVEVQEPSGVTMGPVVDAIRSAETSTSDSETVSVKPGSTIDVQGPSSIDLSVITDAISKIGLATGFMEIEADPTAIIAPKATAAQDAVSRIGAVAWGVASAAESAITTTVDILTEIEATPTVTDEQALRDGVIRSVREAVPDVVPIEVAGQIVVTKTGDTVVDQVLTRADPNTGQTFQLDLSQIDPQIIESSSIDQLFADYAVEITVTPSEESLQSASEAGQALVAEVSSGAEGSSGQLEGTGEKAALEFGNGIAGGGWTKMSLASLRTQVEEVGKGGAEAIGSDGVKSVASARTGETMSVISGRVSGSAPMMRDSGYQAGLNSVLGVAGGMTSPEALQAITSAGAVVAATVKASVDDPLVIASPSRLMRREGMWVPLGFAKGIDDGARTVGKSARALAEITESNLSVDADTARGYAASAASSAQSAVSNSMVTNYSLSIGSIHANDDTAMGRVCARFVRDLVELGAM